MLNMLLFIPQSNAITTKTTMLKASLFLPRSNAINSATPFSMCITVSTSIKYNHVQNKNAQFVTISTLIKCN